MRRCYLLGVALLSLLPMAFAASPQKETINFAGTERTFYSLVPAPAAAKPMPVLILLHNPGQGAKSIVNQWRKLANQERVVLIAPVAATDTWSRAADGAPLLLALIQTMAVRCPLDLRRIYLFGEAKGGAFALSLALAQSQYFAAVAVHAAALPDKADMTAALRKIPIGLWASSGDPAAAPADVRASETALREAGFPVQFSELPGSGDKDVSAAAWEFLKARRTNAVEAQGTAAR